MAVRGLERLADMAGKLKEVRRQGWVDRGVPDAESVADHSYRVAVLAWAVARSRGLDADRALRMALVHDLAEAETGDETPFDDVLRGRSTAAVDPAMFERLPTPEPARKARKQARERAAIVDLADALGAPLGAELRHAWDEYAAQATREARLVKELDRVETLLQAERYAAQQPGLPIGSFRAEVIQRGVPEDLRGLIRDAG
jgi:5'-deoxynucleotidase